MPSTIEKPSRFVCYIAPGPRSLHILQACISRSGCCVDTRSYSYFLVNIVACSQEEEFRSGATLQVVEALIHINNKLQQKEAAEGLLERVMAQREAGDANLKVILTTKYSQLHMK